MSLHPGPEDGFPAHSEGDLNHISLGSRSGADQSVNFWDRTFWHAERAKC